MQQTLPEFGSPDAPPTEPQPPKKPRPKPTRKPQARKVAAPKPTKKRRRKVRRAKPAVAKSVTPRLSVMFDACTRITNALQMLSPKEREAVMESVQAAL